MAAANQAGATTYELSARFKIHRTTMPGHLRRLGVALRRQGLAEHQIDQASALYVQGWSLARTGREFSVHVGMCGWPCEPEESG
jgi:hypothetical protein